LSSEPDFNIYSAYFKRTMTNFNVLNNPSKINVAPTKIAIKTVTQAGTLSQALTRLGVAGPDMNELAIVNGMELTDQVKSGELLKVFSKQYNK